MFNEQACPLSKMGYRVFLRGFENR